ncbi:MAG: hypothetical protein M3Q29_11495 [Chloroflexota bacterium]|nr:hypothetical protein [Chloroflexota bacterium]
MDKPRTSFAVTSEEMDSLRNLAASLRYYTTRGPGAGQIGNITALLSALAAAYARQPDAVQTALHGLLSRRDNDYRNEVQDHE